MRSTGLGQSRAGHQIRVLLAEKQETEWMLGGDESLFAVLIFFLPMVPKLSLHHGEAYSKAKTRDFWVLLPNVCHGNAPKYFLGESDATGQLLVLCGACFHSNGRRSLSCFTHSEREGYTVLNKGGDFHFFFFKHTFQKLDSCLNWRRDCEGQYSVT